jgi:hypothetical protein
MDRHGARTGCQSTDGDRDCDIRTHGNRDGYALDSNSDPQPDPVDRNRHHHRDRYIYSHSDSHCHKHTDPNAVPARDDNLYAYHHTDTDIYPNAQLHTDSDQFVYADGLFYVAGDIYSISYYIPTNSHPII